MESEIVHTYRTLAYVCSFTFHTELFYDIIITSLCPSPHLYMCSHLYFDLNGYCDHLTQNTALTPTPVCPDPQWIRLGPYNTELTSPRRGERHRQIQWA